MRFILLGAPGGGKGTQAKFIANKYHIPQISTGEILRDFAESNHSLGKKTKEIMDSGRLVTDDLVFTLVKKRIKQEDCRNGFLLDGFPRTISQANAMKEEGIKIDYILEFYIPDELIIERIIGRRIHMASGRIYHIKFNPPKIEGKDDITGEKLSLREDDCEHTVRKRLEIYHQMTIPLTTYYQREAQIGNAKYIRVDGTRSISEIRIELEKILK